jgi:spermidine synthase
MSRIDLTDPLKLIGIYTQAMMLSILWKSSPKKVCMLGFGGGRIPMILHHYFPNVVIKSVEIDPSVAEISKKYFGIETDSRLKVVIEDACQYLIDLPKTVIYDIILVDCFTGVGDHPFNVSTRTFYDLCKKHLKDGGVVATNLMESDSFFPQKVTIFFESFTNVYQFTNKDQHVFFGSNACLGSQSDYIKRAKQVQLHYAFHVPFLKRARFLRSIKRHGT